MWFFRKMAKNVKKGQSIGKLSENIQNLKIFWKGPGDCMQLSCTINC